MGRQAGAAVAGWGSLCPERVITGGAASHSTFTVLDAGASSHPPLCSQNISAPQKETPYPSAAPQQPACVLPPQRHLWGPFL